MVTTIWRARRRKLQSRGSCLQICRERSMTGRTFQATARRQSTTMLGKVRHRLSKTDSDTEADEQQVSRNS